jgi:hypothetical protein
MRRLLFIVPILFLIASCDLQRADLFKVASSDLAIYSFDPVNGGPDIPLNAKVTVAFTANMDTWATENAFSISFGGSTYTADDGWFEWFAWEKAFIFHFDPDHFGGDDEYPEGTEITVRIDTGARDKEGFCLTKPFEWSFTTSPVSFSDFTLPNATAWAPSFSEQISPPGYVEILFSEPMIVGTVAHGFVLASSDWQDVRRAENGSFQWYDDRTRFRFYPSKPLAIGKDYDVTFDYIPLDRAGNQLDSADWSYTFSSKWQGNIRIVVDPLQVPVELTDFPVYVDLSQLDSSFFDDVAAGGTDIFVYDGSRTIKLPRELVYIDTGLDQGELWFRAPKLYADRDTVFYILYDSLETDANDPSVWSNGYLGVYHLHNNFFDSTTHAHTANNFETLNQVAKIGNGREFDGINDRIDIPFPDIVKRDGTVSVWIRPYFWNYTDPQTIFDATLPPKPFFFDIEAGGVLRFKIQDSGGNPYEVTNDVHLFTLGSWHHLTGTWRYKADPGDTLITPAANLYLDGDFIEQSGNVLSTKPVLDSPYIGHTRADFETTGKLYGVIDEIQISDIRRSSGWVRTEYNNQNDPSVGGFFKEIALE